MMWRNSRFSSTRGANCWYCSRSRTGCSTTSSIRTRSWAPIWCSTGRNDSGLTDRAIEGRPLALAQLLYGGTAPAARLSGPAIDEVVLLEIALFAIAVHIVAQAAAALLYRCAQHFPDASSQSRAAFLAEPAGGELRPDAGAEQRLVGIDVAHPDHHMAVHDDLLDGGGALARGGVEVVGVEPALQGLGAECRQQGVLRDIA